MKNRRNIVELKYPPENPNDIWLKDGKFYRSTSEGWIVIDSKTEYTSKESMIADNPKGGTIGIDKETGETSIYNDVAEQWSPLSGGSVTSITWLELKDKRDAGKLIPGALYRITDYNCTTTQENTQSAGHQFDIVLLALSENKLAEEGWAMEHPTDVWTITFSNDSTIDCYVYYDGDYIILVRCDNLKGTRLTISSSDLTYNEDGTATAPFPSVILVNNLPHNYFQNSNLSAWKVWYCLDNDKSRFAWADNTYKLNPASIICDCYIAGTKVDGPIDYSGKQFVNGTIYYRDEEKDTTIPFMGNAPVYAWTSENNITIFTERVSPNSNAITYGYNSQERISNIAGGVNHNIHYQVTSYVEGLPNYDFPNGRGVIYRLIDEFNNDIKYDFKNIQFKRKLTDGQYDATNGTETWCYTLNVWYNNMCQDASIVGNTLTDDEQKISGVHNNSFGCIRYDFPIEEPNTITFALGNNVILSIIEDSYYYGIYDNNFGEFFNNNTIGSGCDSNIIGNYFNGNIIRNGFRCNLIGNYFYGNSIGENFTQNVIGNSFINNDIDGVFAFNFVANSFGGITISSDTRSKNYGNNGVELATKS